MTVADSLKFANSVHTSDQASAMIGMAFLVIIGILLYFVPSFVAGNRRHPSAGGIFVLNLFTGWTFIGWVLALVWANSGLPGGVVRVAPVPAAAGRAGGKFCQRCGAPAATDAGFCPKCGNAFAP